MFFIQQYSKDLASLPPANKTEDILFLYGLVFFPFLNFPLSSHRNGKLLGTLREKDEVHNKGD